MDYVNTLIGLLFACFLVRGVLISLRRSKRLAPGPFPLPIIGNLHLLGEQTPHITHSTRKKTWSNYESEIWANKHGDHFLISVGKRSDAKERFNVF
ncbi:hypothetical protein H5410_006613 [Solanum commersonii]|uniref:Cytochrome P450 n=1 Tax=Solanum commersonii TaxID=4109 RepID=A0A9J6AAS4_SOLCO|nr:hypothetical protein H5410_006613 [Solanum commersonii]